MNLVESAGVSIVSYREDYGDIGGGNKNEKGGWTGKGEAYWTAQSIKPMMQPSMQNAIDPHRFPPCASDCWAILTA